MWPLQCVVHHGAPCSLACTLTTTTFWQTRFVFSYYWGITVSQSYRTNYFSLLPQSRKTAHRQSGFGNTNLTPSQPTWKMQDTKLVSLSYAFQCCEMYFKRFDFFCLSSLVIRKAQTFEFCRKWTSIGKEVVVQILLSCTKTNFCYKVNTLIRKKNPIGREGPVKICIITKWHLSCNACF